MDDERTEDRAAEGREEGSAEAPNAQSADQQEQSNQNESQQHRENTAGANRCKGNNVVAYPQDVVLAATSLALALSKGRSQYEIETLINLFSLTTNNLQAILAQILINKKVQDYLETPL